MRKWLNWVALVLVFSVACGFLANWQFHRRESKLDSIALVTQNYETAPVSIEKLVSNGDFSIPKDTWRSVTLLGHYLPEATLLVRNRPNDGQPGFEQLVPFESDRFGVLFVARGWLPTGSKQDAPDSIPDISGAQVLLRAKIMTAEPVLSRGAPHGQIASMNVVLAQSKSGYSTTFKKSYLRMEAETPRVSAPLKAMPKPSVEEGNNLSYALQWMLFALMAVLALGWRIRKDLEFAAGVAPKVNTARKSDLDAAYEDSVTRGK